MSIYAKEFKNIIGFQWDAGNILKSEKKHGVSKSEAEETFFHFNLIVEDEKHSVKEKRFWLLGQTDSKKILFIVFTTRDQQIRIISARVANKKERKIYEKSKKSAKI